MSRERRREMVGRRHPDLSTVRQCALLNINFYNNQRRHQALGYRILAEVFDGDLGSSTEPPRGTRRSPTGALPIMGKTAGLSLNFKLRTKPVQLMGSTSGFVTGDRVGDMASETVAEKEGASAAETA